MPETRERTASGKHAQNTFEAARASGQTFLLKGIGIDATKAEVQRSDASSEAKRALYTSWINPLQVYPECQQLGRYPSARCMPPPRGAPVQKYCDILSGCFQRAPGVLWDILFILAQCPVCKGDHAIPDYHEKRILRGLDGITRHLDTAGKRKREHSSKENKALVKKLSQVDKGYERVAGAHEWEIQPAQPKQRRLSANQQLALLLYCKLMLL
ncbi:hypothetical protein DFH09DRAFT_1084918 [Mycena vulgaris]|nr:hypothetical protein DFH09DRAFT_1103998 [Mycena vulgaris]KAJ6555360.1 hypothetical protein DFH09DRAFT_1084918 [Mycena vulgaris]